MNEYKYFLDEFKRKDTSYERKDTFLELLLHPLGRKYSDDDLRKAYETGIDIGFEQGINKNSVKGQMLELRHSCENEKHKKFYEEFDKLAHEYNIAITYHPDYGMKFIDYGN